MNRRNQLIVGDAARELAGIESGSIDLVVTSPPYFQLRDYGMSEQAGRESHIDAWVDTLVDVSDHIHRVLTPTGTFWLNLGDSYSAHDRQGSARKSLLLAPERLAQRLSTHGWLLRNKIVWHKTNALPTPVADRLAAQWEVIYLFAKQPRYFFDLDAIRQPLRTPVRRRARRTASTQRETWRGPNSLGTTGLDKLKAAGLTGHPLGKNPGDVWSIASSRAAHHHPAAFPLQLVERAVLAGCPERRCRSCRHPYRRRVVRLSAASAQRGPLRPTCRCGASAEPGLVLDPFMGSGTTAIAAERHGHDWLGIELNPEFAQQALDRIQAARPPTEVAA